MPLRRPLMLVLILALTGASSSRSPAAEPKTSPAPAATPVTPELLETTLTPPPVNHAPGPEYSDAERDYNMTIGIERSPGGRLWACWVSGGDSDEGYFVVSSSDDDGQTWSHPRLVINPTEEPGQIRRRILVGNLWTDPDGTLWLFFDDSLGFFDGRAGDWAITCKNPDADKPVWSEPRRIWHGATLNKPTVLSNGEWLLPISLWTRSKINSHSSGKPPGVFPREQFADLDDQRKAHLFVSSDRGQTWTQRGGVAYPKTDFDEHMVLERKDGSLWMLARTLDGISESTSTDQGRTWSTPKVAIPNLPTRFFLRRLASGRILLVKNGNIDERTKSRVRMTAFLSDDEGQTWKGGLVIDERNGVSYPDGFQAPDGRIFISYDRERAKEREVLMATFREEDILAQKPVSPDTRLKVMISKAMKGYKGQ